jgi:spore germination protein KC
MKSRIFILLPIIILLQTFALTGCWNYREIEKLTIVAGVAIDKGKNHKYQVTVETIQIGGGQDILPQSQQISMEGDTIFDAVRNEISLAGKKLYWSHTKVVILSQEIAKDGILSVVDWFNRDSETRADVLLLVSKEKKAKDIFKGSGTTSQIKSFELAEMLKSEKSLSKAPITELWKFANDLETPGIVATLPSVHLKKNINHYSPEINGTAIFNRDKLIGFINSEETKDMLFVLDAIKGGLLIINGINNKYRTPISLEIFRSKTKKQPIIHKGKIEYKIKIDTTVSIDEIGGSADILGTGKVKQLEQHTENILKTRVENCIKHIQSSFGVDVFGFGKQLQEEDPIIWKRMASRWEKGKFKELTFNVNTKVHIKGSGMLSKPIQIGD